MNGSASTSPTSETPGSGPVRRCVVCRQTHRKRALMRFVVGPEGEVHFDLRQKMPGRGINVCPTRRCLEAAAKGAFKRGTKGRGTALPEDPTAWISELDGALERYHGELISNGFRSGQLRTGSNTVERMVRDLPAAGPDPSGADGAFAAYMLATDASEGTRKKFESNASRKGVPVYGLLDRRRLGELTGRDEVVVSAWVTGALFERFAWVESQLEMMRRARA